MRTYRKRSFKRRKTRRGGIGSSLRSSGRTSGTKSDKLERKLKRVRGSRTLKARAAANKALKKQAERRAKEDWERYHGPLAGQEPGGPYNMSTYY